MEKLERMVFYVPKDMKTNLEEESKVLGYRSASHYITEVLAKRKKVPYGNNKVYR